MKSPASSPDMELLIVAFCLRWTHSGPTPSINSALRDSVQGFLNSMSVSHSVELRVKKGDTPASISSQFSIGVVSTAKFGANVAAPPVTFQLVAAPISRMATGSFSSVAGSEWLGGPSGELCPYTNKFKDREAHAITHMKTRVRMDVSELR